MPEPQSQENSCSQCLPKAEAHNETLKEAREYLKSKAAEMYRLSASQEVAEPVSRKLALRAQAYRDAADELVSLMKNPRERLI